MAERMQHPSDPTTDSATQTLTVTENETVGGTESTLRLRAKVSDDKKVKWEEGTVDNEHMGKKKSKCCCIYEKPKLFGESSSDDSDGGDCTGSCRGHKKKCFRRHEDEGKEPSAPKQDSN
ncbi:DgyrCDS11336 [Dimorphilus gyrociliatus]|uniref:E3 ubiquitin-protein ligase PPP1R11 n=1 Tax=Dimorphilus gyrociliatus TaxID=2664684 RepID=A0A7I8W360_9ANNE|nr:DgyrCDS11336 [Dimorphilus gyrociliatus]